MYNASNNENNTFQFDGTTDCSMFITKTGPMYTSSVMFCVINSPTGLIAAVGNALVILAIVKTESLHCPSNVALCCLAVTDFITGLINQPCGVISRILRVTGHYSLYCTFNDFFAFIGLVMTGTSCLTIAVIGVDRCLALHFHLRYQQIVTIPRILMAEFIGLAWAISIGIVRLVDEKTSLTILATTIFIALVLVTAATIATLRTVRIFERKLISEAQLTAHLQNRAIEMNKIKKHSWTLVAIFFIFLLSFIPSLCVALILAASNSNIPTTNEQIAIEAAVTLLLTNASVNPAVYCLRMKEIRQAVWKSVKNTGQVAPL